MNIFTLMGTILVDNTVANSSISETGQAADGLADKLGNGLKTAAGVVVGALTAVGTAAVGMATVAVNAADDCKKALNNLQTQTGATDEEMGGLKETLLSIYGGNYGESFEDVASAIASVKQQTNLTGKELESTAQNAIVLRDTFDWGVDEQLNAVNQLMQNFGVSSEEAFNLIAQGAQNGLNAQGDLMDIVKEYSVHFAQLGLDAEDMFNSLKSGADSGAFSMDKLGDAVKELGIKLKAGDADESLKELGLNADELKKKFNEGGEAAKIAFQEVNKALAECEDVTLRNQYATSMYGTMWEDLGVKATFALSNINGEFDSTLDTMQKIDSIKYDSFSEAIAGIKREIEVGLIIPFGEKLLPYLNEFANWFQENKDQIISGLSGVLDEVVNGIEFLINNLETIAKVAGTAVASLLAIKTISVVVGAITTLSSAVTGLNAAFTFIAANPVALAIIGIGTAAGIVTAHVIEANARQKEWNNTLQDSVILSEQITELTAEQEAISQKTVNSITNQLTTYTQLTNQIAELDAQIAQYGDSTGELESAKQDLVKESGKLLKAIEDEYGSYDNAIEVAHNYKKALDNNNETKKTLAKYTDSYASSLVKETLQTSQLNKQTQDALETYKKYNSQQIMNKEETNLYNNAIKVLQENVYGLDVRLNANTRLWEVNTAQVESSIESNNALNNAKIQQANTFQRMSEQIATGSKEEAKAVIESCEAAIDGLRAQRSAQMMFGGDITAEQKAEMEQYYGMIDKAKAKLNEVSTNITGAAKKAGSEAGKSAKEAAEDVVDSYINMYNQKKSLGKTDVNEQEKMLSELKKKHSDTADHIIKINDFALQESLDIIEQRKEKEELTTEEIIVLYQEASKNYALTYTDKKTVTDAINQEIKDSVDNLTSDIDTLNDKQLSDLIDNLSDMKVKYDDYGYDVEYIEQQITEACKTEYERQYDELSNNVEQMKEKRKELYQNEVNTIDEELKETLEGLDAQLEAIESTATEREKLAREQKLREAIAKAETAEEIKRAQEELDKWLVEQSEKEEKRRIQAAKEQARKDAEDKKKDAKTNYESQLEDIDNFMLEESKKLEQREKNRALSEEELTKLAKEELEQQEKDLQESLDARELKFQKFVDNMNRIGEAVTSQDVKEFVDGSHRSGLSYVPFDGYKAELHEGERVLTKQEAEDYNKDEESSKEYEKVDTSKMEDLLKQVLNALITLPKRQKLEQNMA